MAAESEQTMAADKQRRPHALVVPAFPGGHKSTCMRVARSLRAAGFRVTFVWYSSKSAAPPPAQSVSLSSQAATLQADRSDGHGVTVHVIEDGIPAQHRDEPFFVTPAMQDNLLNLILGLRRQGNPPTCLVADCFLTWTVSVAQQAGIPRVEFWISNALSFLLNHNLPNLRSKGIFPERLGTEGGAAAAPPWKSKTPLMLDCIPCCPPISSELYPAELRFHDAPSPFLGLFLEMCSCVGLSERILINSVSALEPDAIRGLQAMGLSVHGIAGCLLHDAFQSEDGKEQQNGTSATAPANGSSPTSEDPSGCIAWLDTQAESSVIYVAFGTVVRLSGEDMEELAKGLEGSGYPFLWAIRDASSGGEAKWPRELDGLVERVRGRGMVTAWAPQAKVLAHKAIGGYLSHAGWNSTMEALWAGVPSLCCPFLADNRSNAWYVCDVWRAGLELQRTSSGGLHRGYVETGVKALLQSEEGAAMRKKAREMRGFLRKESAERSDSFVILRNLFDDMCRLLPPE